MGRAVPLQNGIDTVCLWSCAYFSFSLAAESLLHLVMSWV